MLSESGRCTSGICLASGPEICRWRAGLYPKKGTKAKLVIGYRCKRKLENKKYENLFEISTGDYCRSDCRRVLPF